MFVPELYQVRDETWLRDVMRDHPLATLNTNGADVPYSTHLPALLAPAIPDDAPLVGSEVIGHLNRANPHWRSLSDGMRALLVFQGPGAYVTPATYGLDPAAPTWDFVSIHLHGRLRLVQDREETFEVILATVKQLESTQGEEWDPTSSLEYFRRILPGVGAFRLEIEGVDAMFKLSQEMPAEMRELVIRHFEDREGNRRKLGRLMREHGPCAVSQEAGA
ncbi:FMN-binding negative transcriptional regulator [Amycolatopsis coloradensis]|uniref:FMN-binding negative transcriptional regulator n=1 Tax=Amycolatopsis coloradensis TaxID=76021 RepID=A0ACD5BHP3_9PSEU